MNESQTPTPTNVTLSILLIAIVVDVILRVHGGSTHHSTSLPAGVVAIWVALALGVGCHAVGLRACRGGSASRRSSLWWARLGFVASLMLLVGLAVDGLTGSHLIFWEPGTMKVAGALVIYSVPVALFAASMETRRRHARRHGRADRRANDDAFEIDEVFDSKG